MTTHCTHVEFTCHFTPPATPRHRNGERDSLPDNVIISRGQLCHNKRISSPSLSTAPGLVSKQHVEISRNFTKLCLRSNQSSQSHCYLTSPSPSSLSPSVLPFTFQRQSSLAYSNSQPHPLSSLPKGTFHESTVAILASILGGFGTVAMFCTVGVYV